MSGMIPFLESIIGPYQNNLGHVDWEWVVAAAFLLLIVYGCILIVRSVISRHG